MLPRPWTPADDRERPPFSTVLALTGTTTFRGKTAYTGYEVWLPGGTLTATKVEGGRVLTAAQPGVFLDGSTPAVGSGSGAGGHPLALGRLGPGAGGQVWELVQVGDLTGGSGGARGGGSCDLETVRFDVVTQVECVNGVLRVVRERISITGCSLSISSGDAGGGDGGPVGGETCCGIADGTAVNVEVSGGPNAGTYYGNWDATNQIATFVNPVGGYTINVQCLSSTFGQNVYHANGIAPDNSVCSPFPYAFWNGTNAENIAGLGTLSVAFHGG